MKKALSKSAEDVNKRLKEEALISEAYLTGLFWCNPDEYINYPEDKLDSSSFMNEMWGFWFTLGRKIKNKEINRFDDISVIKVVKELGVEKYFDKYGGFDAIREVQEEVEGYEDNLEAYYKEVRKYKTIKDLMGLFGDRVATITDKYDYRTMTGNQIHTYWVDVVNKVGIDSGSKHEEHFLLEGLRESVQQWDENPDIGLPFYNSPLLTKICTGWDLGCLYIYGGFGGSGKTSLIFNKVIMSCIENQEKLLIIANEQGIEDFRKLLIATVLGIKQDYLKRQRLNEGTFSEEEKKKLEDAIAWIEEFSQENSKLVAFAFLEDYIMSDVKKTIRHYAARGYSSVLIDTGKPSEGEGAFSVARWEVFTNDFKELYKLTRPNGAGSLNLRMWVNVQLADNALTRRFLNEHAFGDSKKIKNEASVVFMGRALWDSEYEGGSEELNCWRYVKTNPDNPFHDDSKPYSKEEFKLSRTYKDKKGNEYQNVYYVIFTPKNRRGQDNKMGQPVLVLRANLNDNSWVEVGWTTITDDRAY